MKKSLRYNLIRMALVEAIIKASNCSKSTMCPCDHCADLIHQAGACGIGFGANGTKDLTHTEPDLVGSKSRDALYVLSIQHSFQRYQDSNVFSGFMELPDGATDAYQYFSANHNDFNQDISALKRQTAFILVSTAFPDSYLDHFEGQIDANHSEVVESGWEQCCRVFTEINMPILDLPNLITSDISPGSFWTEHFGESGCFDPSAGYGLEFGYRDKHMSTDEAICLRDYVDLWPGSPEYFSWWDNTNQVGTCGGFVLRTSGLLVSQQWFFGDQNDLYINVFNDYVSPILESEPENEFDHVIVVYSAYRNDAYIASKDPRSWDTLVPSDRLLLPLPTGYGLVGNWRETDGDYSPPPLSSFTSNLYTTRLRIAAQYLEKCLDIESERLGLRDSE